MLLLLCFICLRVTVPDTIWSVDGVRELKYIIVANFLLQRACCLHGHLTDGHVCHVFEKSCVINKLPQDAAYNCFLCDTQNITMCASIFWGISKLRATGSRVQRHFDLEVKFILKIPNIITHLNCIPSSHRLK